MKKHLLLFVMGFSGLTTFKIHADTSSLPRAVVQGVQLMADQGICEQKWEEYLPDEGVEPIALTRSYQAWVVPCANWGHNPGFAVFVTVSERSQPDGYITKPMLFVNSAPGRGVYADNVIHNVAYDAETKSLLARYNINGSPYCGSQARYQWNEAVQAFDVKALIKQEDCKAGDVPWTRVF